MTEPFGSISPDRSEQEEIASDEWRGREYEWIAQRSNYLTIVSYLDATAPSRVLDVAAGSGYYVAQLARLGAEVHGPAWTIVAGTESRHHATQLWERVSNVDVAERVENIQELDPRDLSTLDEESFDFVIAIGPLSRFSSRSDRERIAHELVRVLKPSGYIFATFASKQGRIISMMLDPNTWSSVDAFNQLVERQRSDPGVASLDDSDGSFGQCMTADDVGSLFSSIGVEAEECRGSDGIAHLLPRASWMKMGSLDETGFNLVHDILTSIGEDPSTSGVSSEMMYVGKKR